MNDRRIEDRKELKDYMEKRIEMLIIGINTDEDLLQEFIEVSQKSSQHNNSKRKSSIINKT